MSLRTRITLWFLGMLSVSLVLMGGVLYYELAVEPGSPYSPENYPPEKHPTMPAKQEILEMVLYYGIPTALIELGVGWWMLRRALSPITTLTHAVEKVQLNNLQTRLTSTGTGDELDRLTVVFNAMMARLQESFSHIREFTLNASHELKTPLTIMRGELEGALHDDSITPAQRGLFNSQLDEIQRLTKIVDGLTLLAKADSGQISITREPVPLHELLQDSYADAQMLGRAQAITVQLTECSRVQVLGDRHRLRQLLLNLVENAIKYNKPEGTVTLGLHRNGSTAKLVVSNSGAGVPLEIQHRVFDRFFRGDSSHNSAVEGCGLGLSIARWIVAAHGGTIQFVSVPEKLTTVTVTLPLTGSDTLAPTSRS